MDPKTIETIMKGVQNMFPDARGELEYSTPFQLLVAVILSAQSTDKQVNKVTSSFFNKIRIPQDLVKLGADNFKKLIKSIGLYETKGNNIFKTSQILAENRFKPINKKEKDFFKNYGYLIPSSLSDIVKLPGVGPKTAKIILNEFYETDYIPVDTHIHRIANRLGLVQTTSAEKTSQLLEQIIPSVYKNKAHFYLIFFGRYHCKARNPECNKCPFTGKCLYYLANL